MVAAIALQALLCFSEEADGEWHSQNLVDVIRVSSPMPGGVQVRGIGVQKFFFMEAICSLPSHGAATHGQRPLLVHPEHPTKYINHFFFNYMKLCLWHAHCNR